MQQSLDKRILVEYSSGRIMCDTPGVGAGTRSMYFDQAGSPLKQQTEILNFQKHGIEITYEYSASEKRSFKVSEVHYQQDQKDGMEKIFDRNGIKSQIKYCNGQRHGLAIFFNSLGRVQSEQEWYEGQRQGVQKDYTYNQGIISSELEYTLFNGVLDGWSYEKNHQGNVVHEMYYFQGREANPQEFYDQWKLREQEKKALARINRQNQQRIANAYDDYFEMQEFSQMIMFQAVQHHINMEEEEKQPSRQVYNLNYESNYKRLKGYQQVKTNEKTSFDQDICNICHEIPNVGSKVFVLSCKHIFCPCIVNGHVQIKQCPVCKKKIQKISE